MARFRDSYRKKPGSGVRLDVSGGRGQRNDGRAAAEGQPEIVRAAGPLTGGNGSSALPSSPRLTTAPEHAPETGSEPSGLVELVHLLRRRRLILLVWAMGGVAIAIGITSITQTVYKATAKLYFHDQMLTGQLFGSTVVAPTQDPAQTAATDLELTQLQPVAVSTAHHVKGLTASQVAAKVSVAADGQSRLVSITAADHNSLLAAQLANAYAAAFVDFQQSFDRSTINATLGLIAQQLRALPPQQKAGPDGRSLAGKSRQLRILESLQTANVQQVQKALAPASPSSPKPVSAVVFGLIAGLIVGIGLAVIVDRLDRRLRDAEEAQHLFGRPLLGHIPRFRSRRVGRKPLVGEPRVAEAFRLLRTNLRYFQLGRSVSLVVTTSPEPGDGKTTISWNLAVAAASARERVLLIEADLRRPAPSDGSPGLVQVLFGESTLARALVPCSAGEGQPTFDVLYAGAVPPNPADLLESAAMSELLQSAREDYDLVVLDCPPVAVVSDAIPLLHAADGTIVVVSVAKTSRNSCRRLRLELEELEAPVLGIVANRVPASAGGYGEYYAASANARSPKEPSRHPAGSI